MAHLTDCASWHQGGEEWSRALWFLAEMHTIAAPQFQMKDLFVKGIEACQQLDTPKPGVSTSEL